MTPVASASIVNVNRPRKMSSTSALVSRLAALQPRLPVNARWSVTCTAKPPLSPHSTDEQFDSVTLVPPSL